MELDLLQRLGSLSAQFRDGRDAMKVLQAALRLSLDFFEAAEGCVAVLPPGRPDATIQFAVPRDASWDHHLLAAFVRGDPVQPEPEVMLARIRRRGRKWGALAIRAPGADYRWDARRALSSIAGAAAELAARIDQERIRDVRARIDRKIMEQIRPKDLFYQILHGLRSLTDYDHSAALLTCDADMQALEIVAEQIAWRKGKSQNVGLSLPLDPAIRDLLKREIVYGFDRTGDGWHEWTGERAAALAALLDYNSAIDDGKPARTESAMLCAPLVSRDGVLGILKIAAEHQGTFGAYEADLVCRFLPQVAVALRHSQRAESLQEQVLAAERKHAMADLARGVSHDVNNALGAVLPLVQEMREDLDGGTIDPAVAKDDLREIERSLQVCRRIFGGMLNFARGAAQNAGEVHLYREVETTLAILREGMERQEIDVAVDVPRDLPALIGVQSDIEQLLLNLLTNARDAMPRGVRLTIRAGVRDDRLEVTIEDDGCGIPVARLSKVQEPFFTTKSEGSGLGLAICRSIISQMRGRLDIDSEPDRGTRVTFSFALAGEPAT
ncbi:MAG: sensor histidine kinase [Planctomycetota bacterium]